MEPTYIIVGASLAGANAAETLRAEGFDGRIVLIGDETERPYERPPLSKGHLAGSQPREKAFVHEAGWYAENRVDLRLDTRVTSLDPAAHEIEIDGGERLGYDKLLLATGSRVRRLAVPGGDLGGVHYLRTLADSDALGATLRDVGARGGNVVIVGGGWIGLETAAAARGYGAQVTIVEMDSLPLRRVVGDEVARIFADLHVDHGVEFHYGAWAQEFRGDNGHLSSVALSDGSEVPADAAVIGVGVQPNVELAVTAGLRVSGGIITDASLRTSNPDVYACGDVARSTHPLFDQPIRVEHWANALNGGKAAAKAMLGQDVIYDRLPYFFSDQYDLGMEYAGFVEPGGYDDIVFRGDVGKREFIAFWMREGRVLAGMNVNVWDVTDDIQALVRRATTVDRSRLADPAVPLASA